MPEQASARVVIFVGNSTCSKAQAVGACRRLACISLTRPQTNDLAARRSGDARAWAEESLRHAVRRRTPADERIFHMSAGFAVFAIAGAVFLVSTPAAAADDPATQPRKTHSSGSSRSTECERWNGSGPRTPRPLPYWRRIRVIRGCSRKHWPSQRPRTGSRNPHHRRTDSQLLAGRRPRARNLAADSLDDYRKSAPAWTTVLDLDALAKEEKANWFWSGADCAEPAERRLHDSTCRTAARTR